MESFSIKTETLNAVLQYLGTRPFVEVFRIITAIQTETASQQTPSVPELEVVEGGSEKKNKR